MFEWQDCVFIGCEGSQACEYADLRAVYAVLTYSVLSVGSLELGSDLLEILGTAPVKDRSELHGLSDTANHAKFVSPENPHWKLR